MFNSGIRGRRAKDGEGTVAQQEQFVQAVSPQPSITSWSISGSDDNALDPAGGQTVIVNGTGFASGASVTVGGSQIGAVTVASSTRITFTSPANSGGSYTLIVYNSSGGAAILVPGLIYSAVPTWTTAAGSIGSYYETTAINSNVVATSDSAMTYSLASGSLPSGATLYANGVITGTSPVDSGSTTYTFGITATDAELQDTTRTFTLTINTDVVTWSSPASGATYNLVGNVAMSNVSLSATSAAGYGVTYSANTLPSGVSLSGNVIYGTPNVAASTTTLLTATANTTNRTSTNTINWVVTLGDQYWNLTTLALNSLPTTTPFQSDASLNNASISVVADTRASNRNPYQTGYYSNYFDGTGDYISTTLTGLSPGTGNFTYECWFYITSLAAIRAIFNTRSGDTTDGFDCVISTAGTVTISYTNTGLFTSASGVVVPNKWYHFAVVRTSTSVVTTYLNGVSLGNWTAGANTNFTSTTMYVGAAALAGVPMLGYISNFRYVKGTAVYTTNFTPSTTPLVNVSGTSLLTCQSNRLIDSSPNNFTITKNGDTTVLPFNPFATVNDYGTTYYSTYFDGTGDYLIPTANAVFSLGTSDFTIEGWFNTTNASNICGVVSCGPGSVGNGSWIVFLNYTSNAGKVSLDLYGVTTIHSSTSFVAGAWNHFAVVKSAGVINIYVNGVGGTGVSDSTNLSNTNACIGRAYYNADTAYFTGTLSNIRITKGQALYTANFTPSTSPLTTTSQDATSANVSLLTCQSATTVDNSTNAISIASYGQAKPGPVSPFTTTNYTAASTTIPTLGSGYFDGTGDYLNAGSSGAYALGTSAYTVEFWVYHTSLASVQVYYTTQTTGGLQVWYDTTSGLSVGKYGSSPVITSGLNYVVVNQWNHIAVSRVSTSSNSTRIFVNGVAVATGTDSNDYGTISGPLYIGSQSSGNGVAGYISNIRMVKGTALYTANFYPSPTPLTAVTNTSLLTLQYNGGSNDSQFQDSSNLQNVITRAGNTTQGTVSPFSATGWSGYFDGTGDYLSVAANSAFAFGTGSFTIEAWIYDSGTTAAYAQICGASTYGVANEYLVAVDGSAKKVYVQLGTTGGYLSTGTYTANTWNHIAVVRSGTTVTIYLNGTSIGSYTDADSVSSTIATTIGAASNANASSMFIGYISNVRITKGQALYTSAFTPSTTPLTTTSQSATAGNVSLLTLQDPRFIDNSANRLAITVNGDSKTQSFSPFGPVTVTPYYSNYFDGTGDYLTVPANPAFAFGTGDFTIEGWFYNQAGTNRGIFNLAAGYLNSSLSTIALAVKSTTQLTLWYGATQIDFSSTQADYTWNHVAVVRNSGVIKVYTNGVQTYSAADTTNYTYTYLAVGGYYSTSFLWLGYISNFRVTKGLAIYTGTFTPPTAPLAATQSSGTNISAITQDSYSNYFDGTGDYLSLATNTSMDFSTGDFTVEGWVYPNSLAADWFLISATGSGGLFVGYATGIGFGWGRTGVAWDYRPGVLTANTWQHVAVTRSGTSMRIFVNGTQAGTTQTLSTAYNLGTTSTTIGSQGANYYLNGMISNLRVTKGQALYTANFTPSTTPLTTTSQSATAANVSLLTCQSSIFTDNSTNSPNPITVSGNTAISGSNPFSGSTMLLTSQSSTFVDNSVNAFAITVNGDTKPTTIAPFASTTTTPVSYTTAVNGGSMYFDGTGDYLTLPVNTAGTIMGYSDFTVEAWIYPTTYSGTAQVIAAGQNDLASTTGSSWCLYIASSTTSDSYSGSTTIGPASPNPVKNQWSHVAYVRSGTSLKTYLNGVQAGSASFASATTAINNGATTYAPSIGAFANGGSAFAGYMSNFRITKNAVYTGPFVPPVNPNTNTVYTTATVAGTNGSIIDYTGKNNLETVADAKLAPQNPYGGSYYSNYFDGSYDYLTIPSSASLGFGTGDFTIEAWVYLASSGAANGYILFDMRSAGGTEVRPSIQLNSSGTVYYWTQATNKITGGTLTTGQWTHLAVTRASGSTKLFLNGTQSGSTYSDSTDYGSTNRMVIGNTADFPASYNASWNGYVSNFRVVKGQALYTGTFTPSTTPLTTTSQSATASNVSLLTCQSNTIKDNSNNAFTITASGNTAVNSVNPFQNNGTYSMYFDGTGDGLVGSDSQGVNFGSGNFTIEFWAYFGSVASAQMVLSTSNSPSLQSWAIYTSATGTLAYYLSSNGSSWNLSDGNSIGTITTGQWYYVTLVRNGSTFTPYLNGVAGTTTTSASALYTNNLPLKVAYNAYGSTNYTTAYITDLRITKYARYTTAFTPPTTTFQTK